jgi:hypothetical protein
MKKNRPHRRCRPLIEGLEPRILRTVVNSPIISGDTNADGTVNIVDLTQIAQHWQQSAAGPYDLNGDNFVDLLDYTLATQNWQETIYDGRSVVADGVTNIWAPAPAEYSDEKWVAQPSELYGPSGKPVLIDIQSSGTDDSYFLASVGAMALSQPTRLLNLISYDGTGWAVSFDGSLTGQPSAVIHVSREFSANIQPRIPGTGVWWQVMEKAYAYYRTYNGTISLNSFASLVGGTSLQALQTLALPSTTALTPDVGATIDLIRTALAEDRPVVFNTSPLSLWMTPNHSFVVISLAGSGLNSNIVTYDVDGGFYDFWTYNDLLASGLTFTIGS